MKVENLDMYSKTYNPGKVMTKLGFIKWFWHQIEQNKRTM
jgi:hypothetical protein